MIVTMKFTTHNDHTWQVNLTQLNYFDDLWLKTNIMKSKLTSTVPVKYSSRNMHFPGASARRVHVSESNASTNTWTTPFKVNSHGFQCQFSWKVTVRSFQSHRLVLNDLTVSFHACESTLKGARSRKRVVSPSSTHRETPSPGTL